MSKSIELGSIFDKQEKFTGIIRLSEGRRSRRGRRYPRGSLRFFRGLSSALTPDVL